MQVKEDYLLSRKQLEDEKIAEVNLKHDLMSWFDDVLNVILSCIRDEKQDDILYLFQVENIIRNHKQDYLDILSDDVQDFYITHSENVEARINNKVARKQLDNTLLLVAAKEDNLDEWLYSDITSEELSEQIKKKLRYNNNVQSTLNKYLNRYNFNGLKPSDLGYYELLEYEIDEAVIEYMSNNVFTASESTLQRVTQKVYEIIKEAYAEEGEGTYAVADRIQEMFNDLKDFEAERIARTETLKAQSSANHNRLVNNPNVEYVQWLATDDERVRDSHAEVDGEITFADGTGMYSNGLRYPGDTSGDIEEWINCRCDEVAYIPEVGLVPPPGATSWYEDEMLFDDSLEIPEVYVEMDDYLASYW